MHVVLAAGALSRDGARWLSPRGQVLLPADEGVRARFRRSLLLRIRRAWALEKFGLPPGWDEAELERKLARAARRRWHVYSKRTLVSLEAYEYLANYVRSVGLSSARLLAYDGEVATIATRGGRSIQRHGQEVVRLLLLHVLPPGFVRVRHYGLFVSRHRQRLASARRLIGEQGLGCGHAAELEEREEEAAGQGAQVGPDVVLGTEAERQATWQEVCTRYGFEVERCPHCDLQPTPLRSPVASTRWPCSARRVSPTRKSDAPQYREVPPEQARREDPGGAAPGARPVQGGRGSHAGSLALARGSAPTRPRQPSSGGVHPSPCRTAASGSWRWRGAWKTTCAA